MTCTNGMTNRTIFSQVLKLICRNPHTVSGFPSHGEIYEVYPPRHECRFLAGIPYLTQTAVFILIFIRSLELKKIIIIKVGILLMFLLSTCAEVAVDNINGSDGLPDLALDDFALNVASMVLFVDGGEKRLTTLVPSEMADFIEIEWSIDAPEVAEISVDEESVVVVPKGVGNAVIKATAKSKYDNIPEHYSTV